MLPWILKIHPDESRCDFLWLIQDVAIQEATEGQKREKRILSRNINVYYFIKDAIDTLQIFCIP